jgi:hypothetical protein
MALSVLVWAMIGIAVWHFTVFLPDRFWGGIVGAFRRQIRPVSGRPSGLFREECWPSSYLYGARQDRLHGIVRN